MYSSVVNSFTCELACVCMPGHSLYEKGCRNEKASSHCSAARNKARFSSRW